VVTLAAFGKTVLTAVGTDPSKVATTIAAGKVITGVLA
jgi:hypothetical protein